MSDSGRWPGTWRVICDVCGFEFPSDQVKKRWDGLITCSKDYEQKHPQLSLRAKPEKIGVPFARPEPEDEFAHVCDLWTASPMAGFGTAGCMTVGGNTNIEILIQTIAFPCIADIAIADRSITEVF